MGENPLVLGKDKIIPKTSHTLGNVQQGAKGEKV